MAGRIAYTGNIVREGLIFDFDPAKKDSYIGTGSSFTNLASGTNYSLVNGPGFSTDGFGSIVYDGTSNYTNLTGLTIGSTTALFYISGSYQNYYLSAVSTVITGRGAGLTTGIPNNGWVQIGFMSPLSSGQIQFVINGVIYSANTGANPVVASANYRSILFTTSQALFGATTYFSFHLQDTSGGSFVTNGQVWQELPSKTLAVSATSANRRYFSGSMGQVLIYNRTLTAAEVLQNYNSTKGRYGL